MPDNDFPKNIDDKLSASVLETPGGVPYLLVDGYPQGRYSWTDCNITEKYIIHGSNLFAFLVDSFPNPEFPVGGMNWALPRHAPGFAPALCSAVSFEPFPPGKPCDPFWGDPRHNFLEPTQIDLSYTPHIQVTIEYSSDPTGDGFNNRAKDSNDPRTYLTISGAASGEYINTLGIDHRSLAEDKNGNPGIDANPVLITIPEIEWSVNWKFMTEAFFTNVLKPQIDLGLGKVNSVAAGPLIWNAPPETLLFTGYNLRQNFTWRHELANLLNGNQQGVPSIDITFKFLEKNAGLQGVAANAAGQPANEIIGHNHAWKAGDGWTRLYRDRKLPNATPLYSGFDFTNLLQPWLAP